LFQRSVSTLLYAFVTVRLGRRELVWINVTTNPTAEWIARQLTEAFPWDEAPRHLIRDRDRIYGSVGAAALARVLRSLGCERPVLLGLVQDHSRERIELADPELAREHTLGVGVARPPTLSDAVGTEIDVLGMVSVRELRRVPVANLLTGG
jgi:hypothetical protein